MFVLVYKLSTFKNLVVGNRFGDEGVTAIAAALKNNYVVLECYVGLIQQPEIEALCLRNQVKFMNVCEYFLNKLDNIVSEMERCA